MVDCVSAWVIHLCLQFNTVSGFSVVTLICCPWTKSFRIIIHKLTYRRRLDPTWASWDIWRASNTRPLRLFCTHCVDISTNREHQAKPVMCFSTLAHRQILFHHRCPELHSNILLFCDCTDCTCANHISCVVMTYDFINTTQFWMIGYLSTAEALLRVSRGSPPHDTQTSLMRSVKEHLN